MGYRIDGETKWGIEFGQRLQCMIDNKNTTQVELADKLGVSRQIVSRYIHGTSIPSGYKLCQIAASLECNIDDLVGT